MAKKYQLLPSEAHEAALWALQAAMAILLREVIDGSSNRENTVKLLGPTMEGLIRSLGAPSSIPEKRHREFVQCAVDNAHRLVENAVEVRKAVVPKTKH